MIPILRGNRIIFLSPPPSPPISNVGTNNDKNGRDNPSESGDNTSSTIKEYLLHFKIPNPCSTQMYYIFSAWSCPLFGRRAREILLYALLLKLFDYSIYLVISTKLLTFKAVIA
jgi:hypothetical protein